MEITDLWEEQALALVLVDELAPEEVHRQRQDVVRLVIREAVLGDVNLAVQGLCDLGLSPERRGQVQATAGSGLGVVVHFDTHLGEACDATTSCVWATRAAYGGSVTRFLQA